WKDWVRPPRHLLILFFGITAVSAATLAWLSWQLVRQDRALAAQRAQEQRENAAGLAAAALQKHLSGVEERLTELASLPEDDITREAEEYSRALPKDSVLLILNSAELEAFPAGHLIYYPVLPATPEADTAPFAKADTLEFQQNDYAGAIAALEALSHSPNLPARAESLVRLARNL